MPKTIVSDSMEGMSSLPTNSHAAMLMVHRCAASVAVKTTLATDDLIHLGKLPNGYTVEGIKADSDGIAGLTADIILIDPNDESKIIELAKGVSFINAGQTIGTLTLNAVRFKGFNQNSIIAAKVVEGGELTKGKEVGVTIEYKYRQVTY